MVSPTCEARAPEGQSFFYRFVRILYFFLDPISRHPLAHVCWFVSSTTTPLGLSANPRQLFLTDHCDNISVDSFISKGVHLLFIRLPSLLTLVSLSGRQQATTRESCAGPQILLPVCL